jgi:hypothetical protein
MRYMSNAMTDIALSSTPQIVEFVSHLLWRPRFVSREIVASETDKLKFHLESMRQAADAEQDIANWIAAGRRLREGIWSAVARGDLFDLEPESLAPMIEAIEAAMERDASEIARMSKTFRRSRKRIATVNVNGAELIKELDDKIIELAAMELSERSDMALFLRALRAEIDPASRGGRVFSDPDSLRRDLSKMSA